MRQLVLIFGLLIELGQAFVGQETPLPPEHPRVSLILPAGTSSETMQINYYMTGPFGGYGMWVKPEKNRAAYEIDASVEARPARNLKVIAWLPGCEIITLELAIEHASAERQLGCKALSSFDFKAQIFPVAIVNDRPAEVEAAYVAYWSHGFFGIYDGPLTTFHIGKVVPDADGTFEIKLPDLASQPRMSDGEFTFILCEKNTGNLIAFLKPMDTDGNTPRLKVLHEYPSVVRFAAEQP